MISKYGDSYLETNKCNAFTEFFPLVLYAVVVPIDIYMIYIVYSLKLLVYNDLIDRNGNFINLRILPWGAIIVTWRGREIENTFDLTEKVLMIP